MFDIEKKSHFSIQERLLYNILQELKIMNEDKVVAKKEVENKPVKDRKVDKNGNRNNCTTGKRSTKSNK